jgi:hypothetical protein
MNPGEAMKWLRLPLMSTQWRKARRIWISMKLAQQIDVTSHLDQSEGDARKGAQGGPVMLVVSVVNATRLRV